MGRYSPEAQSMLCPTCHGDETLPVGDKRLDDWTPERLADTEDAAADRALLGYTIPTGETLCPACLGTGYVDPDDYA